MNAFACSRKLAMPDDWSENVTSALLLVSDAFEAYKGLFWESVW